MQLRCHPANNQSFKCESPEYSKNANFGGIYFAPNGYMYGVNVFTRRIYQIDISTGAVTYVSTEYRIKALLTNGSVVYSPILRNDQKQTDKIVLLKNPLVNGNIELSLPSAQKNSVYSI